MAEEPCLEVVQCSWCPSGGRTQQNNYDSMVPALVAGACCTCACRFGAPPQSHWITRLRIQGSMRSRNGSLVSWQQILVSNRMSRRCGVQISRSLKTQNVNVRSSWPIETSGIRIRRRREDR